MSGPRVRGSKELHGGIKAREEVNKLSEQEWL